MCSGFVWGSPGCSSYGQAEKWGLPVGGNYMELLLFADNCWLIAMPPAELKCMARAWNELLKELDCELCGKPDRSGGKSCGG